MSVTYGQQEGVGGCHRDGRQHKQWVYSMGGPGAGPGGDEDAGRSHVGHDVGDHGGGRAGSCDHDGQRRGSVMDDLLCQKSG